MAKYVAHGTIVTIDSIPVGGLVSVGIPDRTRGEAEVTDSDSGFDREFIGAFRDPGEVELSFRHDPDDAGQKALDDNYDQPGGQEIVEFQIKLPDAATGAAGRRTYTFDGYVSTAPTGDLALADDEAAELTATIRVSGPVTISSP